MDDVQLLRIKTSMLVYSLEQALGSFVLNKEHLNDHLSSNCVDVIINRELQRGKAILKDDIGVIIESSYLDEIFGFALDVSKGSIIESYIKQLKQLCHSLDVFTIRNAVSHPNRPFPECYWYRAAAICSDPLIEKLDLRIVSETLCSAVSGNLNEPPEFWLYNVKWAIPNNLSRSFDHEITGLLGRDKEFKELGRLLSLPRENLIAIVAPGGVGKTALILQYLKDLSLTPESNKFVDAIIYCSLKNEELTAEGIKEVNTENGIDTISSIDAVKENILDNLGSMFEDYDLSSFDDACGKLADKKILLCVDNLETLLVDSQNEFLAFNSALPIHWRVLVTSRISLESATTVPLEVLGAQHAVFLARNYFKKRGVSSVEQDDLKKIAKSANNNPLAIRLTIDLYLKGKGIPESISKSQKDIASFSYKNLIDSLSENSVSILETIFSQQNSSRSELAELLELSFEDIAESVNELTRTSLISRSSDVDEGESYRLSDSIRELLLVNPKNIEVRLKISGVIRKRKEIIQEYSNRQRQLGVTEFSEEYIAPETVDNIKLLALETNKLLKQGSPSYPDLQILQKRYNDSLSMHGNSYLFNYNFSRVLSKLNDSNGELTYLLNAERFNAESPRVKQSIAYKYFSSSEYDKSEPYYLDLINKGYSLSKNSDRRFAYRITKGYLQSLLFQAKFKELFEFTDNWESIEENRELLGSYRASAFKRSIEHKIRSDVDETITSIKKAIIILGKVFSLEGYSRTGCNEAYKVVKEVNYIASGSVAYPDYFLSECLCFVADHFFDIVQNVKNISLESHDIKTILKNLYSLNLENNPLREVKWYQENKSTKYNAKHIEELVSKGYEIVVIYHVPENEAGMPNYMFAKGSNDQQYYLNVDKLSEGWIAWSYLDVGTKLAIKFDPSSSSQDTRPATEIIQIEVIN